MLTSLESEVVKLDKKEILDQIKSATAANKQLVSQLENMNSTEVVAVKLIPNTDDQYYYNGDFIIDDSRAVYRGYALNNSESILFKAGREYEKRIKDARLEDIQQMLDNTRRQLEAVNTVCDADNKNSEIRIKNLCHEIQGLKDALQHKDKDLSDTLNSFNSLRAEYDELKSVFANYKDSITSAKIEMFKRGVMVKQSVDGIVTPYGKILEE